MFLGLFMLAVPAQAFVYLDVHRDGYVEDVSFDANIALDGIPDAVNDTQAILTGRGDLFNEFSNFRFDSHGIMTYDIVPYHGMDLLSAQLYGYGHATGSSNAISDPINARFYSYGGDGGVGLADFDAPADLSGSFDFFAVDVSDYVNSTQNSTFEVDVTDTIKQYFHTKPDYLKFRVEAEDIEVYISAGEINGSTVNTDYDFDGVRHGPRLRLAFAEQNSAAVPEPATLFLFGSGLAGAFIRRRMIN